LPDEQNPPASEIPGLPPDPAPQSDDGALSAMQRELAELRTEIRKRPAAAPEPPARPQPAPQPAANPASQKAELERQFWADPLTMTHVIATTAAANERQNILNQHGATLESVAKERARAADPETFDKLEPHILEKMAAVDQSLRTNPGAWANAFNLVKGERINDVIELKSKAPRPSGGPAAPSTKPAPAPPATQLTPEEQHWANVFRLSPDQYKEGREIYGDQAKHFGSKPRTPAAK
jgi:hypothetical protein